MDGAIHKVSGPRLLEACRKVKAINGIRCPTGEARITAAGDLPSKYVIHTVGPIYRQSSQPKALLESAYYNSLLLAKENGCSSIPFPAISCGVYGYPLQDAAHVSINVCSKSEFADIKIFFYLFGERIHELWTGVLESKSLR